MLTSKRLATLKINRVYVKRGPNVVANCKNDITLYVEVTGEVESHRFLWEQISGNPIGVQYTTPLNELTLSYTNVIPPGTRDDKLFRFWVDKGTARAQYYDFWVWSSPVEIIPFTPAAIKENNVTTAIGQASSINAWVSHGTIVDVLTNQTHYGYFLEWNPPVGHTSSTFINYVIQKYVAGDWVTVETLTDNSVMDFFMLGAVPDTVYRVIASYRLTKTIHTVTSNLAWWCDQNITMNPHIYHVHSNATYAGYQSVDQSVVSNFTTFSTKIQSFSESAVLSYEGAALSSITGFTTFSVKNEAQAEQVTFSPNSTNINNVLDIKVSLGSSIGTIGG